MSDIITFKKEDVDLPYDIDVDYYYEEPESPSRWYPGSPEHIEINSIHISGTDIVFIVPDFIEDEIEDDILTKIHEAQEERRCYRKYGYML